jgi:hypothetical protein
MVDYLRFTVLLFTTVAIQCVHSTRCGPLHIPIVKSRYSKSPPKRVQSNINLSLLIQSSENGALQIMIIAEAIDHNENDDHLIQFHLIHFP